MKESTLSENPSYSTAAISLNGLRLTVSGPRMSSFINRSGKSLHLVLLENAGYGNITTTEVVSDGWSLSRDEHLH